VLELDCEQRDASGQHYRILFIVEAMGRRSNLVLVDSDGAIIDAARRSPPSRNPRRPVLPHLPYEPPPPQDRLFPDQLSPPVLADAARGRSSVPADASTGRGGTLAAFLGQIVAGLSPLAARELAFRSAGATDAPLGGFCDWHGVLHMLGEMLQERQPTIALREDQPVAYAPYKLEHHAAAGAHLRPYGSISEAMSAFYAADHMPARGDALAGERRALLEALARQLGSTDRRIAALQHQLDSSMAEREPLRQAGELILTYQPALGTPELIVDSHTIALDPALTPSENAQAYFARYRKAREAAERVPALLSEAQNQAAYLAELRTLVEVASDMNAIRALRREVGADKPSGKRAQPPSKSAPYRRVPLMNGWEALIGTSAAGNAHVTFDIASADDLWLHARGVPGAHLILRGPAAEPPPPLVERAAELAAWHSASRTANRVEVDVAPRRYVKKIPNAPPGLVRYSNERTVRVTPRA
jgi:predicted ribosome quality control (RQC) complex YloA/Tae2 family protein